MSAACRPRGGNVSPTEFGRPTDRVVLRLPAIGAYLSVLRTATASLASRLDFTLDDIEDLRIAVDEACAMLLAQAVAGADFECAFELSADAISVSVTVPTIDGEVPTRDTFAWTVLTALAGEVDATVDADRNITISLLKRRAEDAEQIPAQATSS
jgi:serine/threonine-protein kinase RsbW